MNFLMKLNNMLRSYCESDRSVNDNALLYGKYANTPPLAEHIIFSPMPEEVRKSLIGNYKGVFPVELLALYKVMNGAELFWTSRLVGKNKIRIAANLFSIFGVPLTYNRQRIEPHNISIEDLNRPKGTPDSWLKFGSYCMPETQTERLDLFVDTQINAVYAIKHSSLECCVVEQWDSIDDCLCEILITLIENNSDDSSQH